MKDEDIVPSSGFTASVMDAIKREATAPPSIPFPWKWAFPGIGWCLVAGIAFLTTSQVPGHNPPSGLPAPYLPALLDGGAWITAALIVSFFSVALSIRLTRRMQH